jgi:autotransporter-associated beta strand protein
MKTISPVSLLVVVTCVALAGSIVQAQTTIADFTFETNLPVTNPPYGSGTGPTGTTPLGFPISPEIGSGSVTGMHANSATLWSGPAGNMSFHSFNSNNWAIGDYYQFQTSAVGLQQIAVQWDQTSSNTGPRDFVLQYSTDGSNFTQFGSQYSVLANAAPNPLWGMSSGGSQYTLTFGSGLTSVSGIYNQPNVYFRLVDNSTTSANGGTVASAGTDRIDNFIITGIANPTYWNGSTSGVGPTGASDVWDNAASNWNSNPDGSGTQSAFNANQTVVFAGTAGAVNIASSISANSGIQITADNYVITGGTLNIGSNPSTNFINVGGSNTATVNSQISGSNGLTKSGTGILVVNPTGSANNFSGDVTISGGLLSVATPAALGTNYGNVVLSGGGLQITSPGSYPLPSSKSVSGAAGTLDLASGVTLTLNGPTFNGGTPTGPALILSNKGTLVLAYNGGNENLGSLTLSDTGTVQVSNSVGSVPNTLFLNGNLSASNAAGTATFDGNIDFGVNNQSIRTASANTILQINGNITNVGAVTFTGSGLVQVNGNLSVHGTLAFAGTNTVELNGDNSGTDGSNGGTSGPHVNVGDFNAAGPIVKVKDANSLGSGTRQVDFNSGTLQAVTPGNAPLVFGNNVSLSIGAFGANNPAVFSGAPMVFNGGVSLFKNSTGATPLASRVTVNDTTTFNAGWDAATNNTGMTGANPSVVLAGSGHLIVNGDASGNILQDLPMIVDALTVDISGHMTSSGVTSYRLSNGATLNSGIDNALVSTATLTLGDTTTNTGATYALNGFSQTLTGLTLHGASSVVDMGSGTNSLTIADSHANSWDSGALIRINNWNGNLAGTGPQKIFVGDSSGGGLSVSQLAQVHFTGYLTGSQLVANGGNGELVPQFATQLRRGDANFDGTITVADIAPMMNALSNLSAYQSAMQALYPTFDNAAMVDLLDTSGDGSITNADIEGLINELASAGGGTLAAVPEPSTLLLGLFGAVAMVAAGFRQSFARGH